MGPRGKRRGGAGAACSPGEARAGAGGRGSATFAGLSNVAAGISTGRVAPPRRPGRRWKGEGPCRGRWARSGSSGVSSSTRPPKRQTSAKAKSAGRSDAKSRRKPAKRATTPSRKATGARRPARTVRTATARSGQPAKRLQRPQSPKPAPVSAPAPPIPPRPPIRLPASATSRLTIKLGPPAAPRTQLELSSKPRPSGPRLLSQVELDEDEVLIDAFDATLDGVRVRIPAVLERTSVFSDRDGDRRLARKNYLGVEADKFPIPPRTAV